MARSTVVWCVAAMVFGTAAGATAGDEVAIGLTADYVSKYVWRGQNVIDDWVLQPAASLSYKGFTGSLWGNVDTMGEAVDDWEFNEIDYALDYSGTVPGQEVFGFSVGVIYYDFPSTAFEATAELYGGISADWPLSPAVTWYLDIDEADGSYFQFAIGQTFEKIAEWTGDYYCSVELGASVGYGTDGYNDFYFDVDDSALNDLTLSAGLPIAMGPWTIKPLIAYSMMIGGDVREGTRKSDNLWGGVSASLSF